MFLGDFGGFRLYSGDLTFVRLCGSLRAKIATTDEVYKGLNAIRTKVYKGLNATTAHIYKGLNDPNSYQNHIIITIIIKILKH